MYADAQTRKLRRAARELDSQSAGMLDVCAGRRPAEAQYLSVFSAGELEGVARCVFPAPTGMGAPSPLHVMTQCRGVIGQSTTLESMAMGTVAALLPK